MIAGSCLPRALSRAKLKPEMTTGPQLHEALESVRRIQQSVLERQKFRGYSGRARAASGTLALGAAAVMSRAAFPKTPEAFLWAWGLVFAAAVVMNGAALAYWFLRDPRVNREPGRLRPVLEVVPPLAAGGVLTLALLLHGQRDALYGTWMVMFGLANVASRHVLPRPMALVGLFYLVAGSAVLLAPGTSFMLPWPMGTVFFAGEWAGGMILHFDQNRRVAEGASDDGAD
jgi:hypothetical protein